MRCSMLKISIVWTLTHQSTWFLWVRISILVLRGVLWLHRWWVHRFWPLKMCSRHGKGEISEPLSQLRKNLTHRNNVHFSILEESELKLTVRCISEENSDFEVGHQGCNLAPPKGWRHWCAVRLEHAKMSSNLFPQRLDYSKRSYSNRIRPRWAQNKIFWQMSISAEQDLGNMSEMCIVGEFGPLCLRRTICGSGGAQ